MSLKERVYALLKSFSGLDSFEKSFWTELNYERVNQTVSRRGWTDTASKTLKEDPILFASAGRDNNFHIIYSRLDSDQLPLTRERPVVSKLLSDYPYALEEKKTL